MSLTGLTEKGCKLFTKDNVIDDGQKQLSRTFMLAIQEQSFQKFKKVGYFRKTVAIYICRTQ